MKDRDFSSIKGLRLLSPLLSVLCNLLLAYVVYMLARIVFLAENLSVYSAGLSLEHIPELIRGSLMFDTTAILYTNALWVVMVLFPVPQKETDAYHRLCRLVFVVINILSLILNLCDTVYFRFSARRTTTTVFQEFQNENNLGSIFLKESLSHWYFFIFTAVIAWGLWKLYFMPRLHRKDFHPLASALSLLLSLIAFTPFCVAGMRGGWTRDTRPITISNANNFCNHPQETALVLNTPFSLIRTIGKNLFSVPDYFPDESSLEAVFSPIHIPEKPQQMNKKNVIVIILESFGKEYFGIYNPTLEDGRYEGATPFLDSLIRQSLSFKYSYANGKKSIDGMPSILSSIPMFVEPFFLSPYSVNDVSGLADCLGRKGYQTAFFHGAERGSMGFMAFARATKFQDYWGREDFNRDPRTNGDAEFDGWWGISDEPFMQYFVEKMSDMQQPFMTALFTLSSHHPFTIPKKYKERFPEKDGELPILKAVRYVDMSLEHFFAAARKQPWFENTLFVITNDHNNISAHDEYKTELGGFASPVIFYDPSGTLPTGINDSIIAQQIDIMPTVLTHLGYDEPYLAFGKDLLSVTPDSSWAASFVAGTYFYMKDGHVLLFDGTRSTALYSLDDLLMRNNLLGTLPSQQRMETELKAVIQQYMERMTQNRLIP